MHPEDLLRFISEGQIASFGGADWKYGWPHKFYVDVTNPQPEKLFVSSVRSWVDDKGERREETTHGTRATLHGKFYNEHLEDVGFDDEAITKLTFELERLGGIRFYFAEKDGKRVLAYRAPYAGYQR